MLRSSSGGLTGLTLCYALRRLSNNIQEPYRTLSLQAIDASIHWWKGKPAPRASALRAPWSLSPDLQKSLKHFLRQWHLQVLAHQVPCHVPSFKTIFVKHASVLDQLCNHKQAVTTWSTNIDVECCCKKWSQCKKASLNPSDPHLSGSLILAGLLSPEIAVIAECSLLNKVFPTKKDYQATLTQGLRAWTKRNGLRSMPTNHISDLVQLLWQQHINHLTHHITKSTINSLHSSPVYVWRSHLSLWGQTRFVLTKLLPVSLLPSQWDNFHGHLIFETAHQNPQALVTSLVSSLQTSYGRPYPWAIGKGRQLPSGYVLAKKKKAFQSRRPIMSFSPMSADAQHPGLDDFSTHPSGLPQPFRLWRCLHTPKDSSRSSSQWRSHPVQPGSGRFFH